MLKTYLKSLYDAAQAGDAREESYYSSLERLFNAYAVDKKLKNIHVTTLPKKTDAGNPDFRIWDGQHDIIGYIEAKEPTKDNLDVIETTEQLKRYRHTFPNLVLTNFLEFRLYRNGECIDTVQIARPFILNKLKAVPAVEHEEAFYKLLEKYFAFSLPKTYTAKTLALELAKRTRFLRDEVITEELKEEDSAKAGNILGFYEAFQQSLIAGLTKEEFADLYSQTLTYGLFAARTRCPGQFNRELAFKYIPRTIGILRSVFQFISSSDIPKPLEWAVDDIAAVLNAADVNKLLHEYYEQGKGKDPIVHFYETFLSEYDPSLREKRGVYYTPEPVVGYIVRSLHQILKDEFNKADGLASPDVTVLDPAAGTLTFLAEAAKLAVNEFVGKYGKGSKDKFIKEHILKNFYAFELMMAPYAVGHLKMGFLLEELGYKLRDDDRFKLYLTNTLEMDEFKQTNIPFMAELSKESKEANHVKRQEKILVIMGNPPYSGHSTNKGDWISKEIKEYFKVDGKPLGERNPKWLQDDYVKFIRFAQWKIEQSGQGVVGMITNHGYLDNPTFRGMRQSLMNTFDEIRVLDLHGNTLKKEKCPDGSVDKNVFDIKQGVAIVLMIKHKTNKGRAVFHTEKYGLREEKYLWLDKHEISNTKWTKVKSSSPTYFFYPRNEEGLVVYNAWPSISAIFSLNVTGVVTARDELVIDFDKAALNRRIEAFRNIRGLSDEELRLAYKLKDTSGWKLSEARKTLANDDSWDKYYTKILYRPFDIKWIYYCKELVGRGRFDLMPNMQQSNISIVWSRPMAPTFKFTVFVTDNIIDQCVVGNKSAGGGISYLGPLWIYNNKDEKKKKLHPNVMMLFEPSADYNTKKPNIAPDVVEKLAKAYGKAAKPEQIFNYIYAVLYSNTYRIKYAEFLKSDFPRVPFTADYTLFVKLSELGEQLTELHLLKSKILNKPIVKFEGKGNNRVGKLVYEKSKLYINETQYFSGLSQNIYEYQIGGYQVCHKWLKDRKGRILSLEEIQTYCKIATSLHETVVVQKEIDKLYDKIENKTI
jgi:type I restriction-modification system DNA methylase subunit